MKETSLVPLGNLKPVCGLAFSSSLPPSFPSVFPPYPSPFFPSFPFSCLSASSFLSLLAFSLFLSPQKNQYRDICSPYLTWFSSVAQLCPTLCDRMNCSSPGLPVHLQLPESTQTYVPRVSALHSLWSYFSTDLQEHTGHLLTWGVPLSVSYLFDFSYCSWGSQGKNTEVVCHSLLQWTTFCQNSPP